MNKKLKLEELERLSIEEFEQAGKFPLIILLDNIRSHHNVGAAFRMSDAFRIEELILAGYTPVPPHKEIRKTALGATESVKWRREESALAYLKSKKEEGFRIISLEQTQDGVSLEEYKHSNVPTILVAGNEVEGVEQEIIDISDLCLEIPQFGTKHSLNVSVALGITSWKLIEGYLKNAN